MGKPKNGILGAFSGKVGPIVGVQSKVGFFIRSRVTPKNPQTPKQQKHRNAFTLANFVYKRLKPFVTQSFGLFEGRRPQNVCVSYVMNTGIRITEEGPELDFENLQLSAGMLKPAADATAERTGNNEEIRFSWTNNSGEGNARPNDRAMLLAIEPEEMEPVFKLRGAPRSEETDTLTLPADLQDCPLHLYLCFISENQEKISDSVYLGCLSAD